MEIITMQAILEKNEIKNKTSEREIVLGLLSELETADNKVKNEIENKLVVLGRNFIPELVRKLQAVKGNVRGVIAMVLIRIGSESVAHIENAVKYNREFGWMAQYLISEINGCSRKVA